MTQEEIAALERSSFNNFDPDGFDDFDPDTFDPDGFDNAGGNPNPVNKVKRGKIGKLQAQFDIVMTSSLDAATSLNIELFNGYRSISGANNAAVNALVNNDINTLKTAIVAAAAGNDLTDVLITNKIFFDAAGNLVFSVAPTKTVSIACRQVPYKALFESSKVQPFKVEKLRMTVTTSGQIDNDIVHITNSFLGSQKRNTISPRSYFRPDQFQNLIIDVPASFAVDGEKGLEYTMNGKTGAVNEVVTFNMFMSRYVKQSI